MPPLKGEVVWGRLRRETGGVSARQTDLSVTAVHGGDSRAWFVARVPRIAVLSFQGRHIQIRTLTSPDERRRVDPSRRRTSRE